MAKLMQWLEKWAGGGPGGAKRVQALRWLILVGLVGAGLMMMNSFLHISDVDSLGDSRASPSSAPSTDPAFAESKPKDPFRELEAAIQNEMRDILEKIVGVGEVDILVTVDSTEELVVQQNVRETHQVTDEKDTNGATRHITEVTRSGEVVLYKVGNDQEALIVKQVKPKIRGVVVVARGAENLTVKSLIIEAVSRGLDVPPHRISVVPRKQ